MKGVPMMKRKISLILAATLLFGAVPMYNTIGVSVSAAAEAASTASTETKFSDIVINIGANETEMNFVWYQNTSTPGTLVLAKAEDIIDGEMPEDAMTFEATSTLAADGNYSNQVTATGFEANTKYGYQPTCGDCAADIWYFTTDGEDDFSFIYVADPQLNSTAGNLAMWENTIGFIENTRIFDDTAFMLTAGDQIDLTSKLSGETVPGDEREYDAFLDHDFIRETPMVTIIGNHDVSPRFDQHFHNPNESTEPLTQVAAGNNSYFTYNDVLFINVNGNVQSEQLMAAQRDFIKTACEAYPNAKRRVVITHQAVYGVAHHAAEAVILGARQGYIPIYEEFDIDVVLQGHDHVYCRTYLMKNFVAMEDVS